MGGTQSELISTFSPREEPEFVCSVDGGGSIVYIQFGVDFFDVYSDGSGGDNRVALRLGDWKIVGNDTLTKFMLFEVQKDWKEENDLASKMPEKADEMKKLLIETWKGIEIEGPKAWWLGERNKPMKGATINY